MKGYLVLLVFFICLQFMGVTAQDTAPAPVRTPEQEAVLQTQKMERELNLNGEQQKAIYEINLKHARERQVSNSRSQALERTKNKNSAIKQVLSHDQYDQLQNKRYERYPSGDNVIINRAAPQTRQVLPNNPTQINESRSSYNPNVPTRARTTETPSTIRPGNNERPSLIRPGNTERPQRR